MSAPTTVRSVNVPTWSTAIDVGIRRTTTADLPPAKPSAVMLSRALVEVLSGRRLIGQLRIHCSPDIYDALTGRVPPSASALPHLVSVQICEPADGVAEISAVFLCADRVRALAFRLEGIDGRWRIIAMELG